MKVASITEAAISHGLKVGIHSCCEELGISVFGVQRRFLMCQKRERLPQKRVKPPHSKIT
jgi:hypothetical protein